MANDLEGKVKDAPNGGVDEFYVAYTPRLGALKQLSEKQYRDKSSALIEYVRNTWDADADNCWITYKADKIIIKDDGLGMTRDELRKFMRIGEGGSKTGFTDEKKRQYMGEYGVGNLAAYSIGEGIRITTVSKKNGKKIVTDINYKDLEKAEKAGQNFYDVKKVAREEDTSEPHGTVIEIYGINKKYRTRVTELLEKLKKDIGVRMRTAMNQKGKKKWNCYLNGKKIDSYIDQFLKGAKEHQFEFEVEDPDTNQVHRVRGWYKVAKDALDKEFSGIYPVINSEMPIKDGHRYNPDSIGNFMGLKHRIYGCFEADFLKPLLDGNRDGFTDEDSPLLKNIYNQINKLMRGLVKEEEERKRNELDQGLEKLLEEASKEVSFALSRVPIFDHNVKKTEIRKVEKIIPIQGKGDGGKKKWKPTGGGGGEPPAGGDKPDDKEPNKFRKVKVDKEVNVGGHKFNIRHADEGSEKDYARLNAPGEEIIVNTGHSMFKKAKSQGEKTLKMYIICNVLKKLAEYKALVIDKPHGTPEHADEIYNNALKSIGQIV